MEDGQENLEFNQQQQQHHHKTQIYMEEDDEEEFIARPSYSFYTENPLDSSPMTKRRRSSLKRKKRIVPQKPSSLKSNAKQVTSDACGKSGSRKKKRTRIEDLYDNDEAKFSVMERADEVLANLADGFPSFVKCMLPSNVTHGFWLIFPKKFCNLHLPMHDTTVILVGEWGKEYEANYLVERHGLSGGWRGFSLAHRLLKGDRLVFHLIRPCTFKVHIVRVYGLDEVDAALCLMNLVSLAKRTYSDKNIKTRKKAKKYKEPLLLDIPPKNILKSCPAVSYSNDGLVEVHSKTNSDSSSSKNLEGSRISDHQANESSCSQNPILHENLLEVINYRFTTGKVS